MTYVDGFVAAVPKANKEQYIEHAKKAGAIFKEVGMLSMMEAWGDDVPEGEVTSFRKAVKQEDDEVVIFSWCIWPSKEVRDAGWAKVMEDPRMQPDQNPMPLDGKRLIYGGFMPIVEI